MNVPVWITVDFFFRDWDQRISTSALWLCVQPHVERKYLQDWISACGSLSKTQNQLWTSDLANPGPNFIDPETLIPIPFPSDTNVGIKLSRDGNVILDKLNDRVTGPNLTDPGIFSGLNQLPQPAPTNPPFRTSSPTLHAGPFARVFNEELVSAYGAIPTDDPTADPVGTIANQLQLALHGGTTRWFSDKCFDQLTSVDLLELDPSTEQADPGVRITNQHSLLGLQFLLTTRDKADVLSTPGTTSFVIELTAAGTPKVDLDLAANVPSGELDQWFDWFVKPIDDVSSGGSITADVLPDFNRRIYVQDVPEAFTKLEAASPFWRRRTQEPAGNGRSVSFAKRFLVRPAKQTDPPPQLSISVQPFVALDCELRRYRNCQIDKDPGLLRLRPKPRSRGRFAASFASNASPQGMVILGANASVVASTWLGAYQLPWDATESPDDIAIPTVLFWGLPPDSDVTVLVPATSGVINCTWTEDQDQLGRRWEAKPAAFPAPIADLSFDALELLDPVDDVSIGVIFPDSLNFASARSVEAIEGALRMTYPHPDLSSRKVPPDDYAGDLANYNALNVRHSAANQCTGVLLNPHGYDFAVWHKAIKNGIEQTFHYRFGFNGDPNVLDSEDAKKIGQFFHDQYQSVGTARPLDFELVHTYGIGICFGKLDDVANPHARLPVLPNEVAPQKKTSADNTAFLTVDYSPIKGTDKDVITLKFDVSIFSPSKPSNDDERRSQQMRIFAAFRSLAEIGYAETATLTVRGCTFDYSQLVGKGLNAPLAYGLKDDETAKKWTYDLSQLATLCRQRLLDNTVSLDLTIALTSAESAIFRNCNLLEFSVEAARSAAAAPVLPKDAQLLRISNDLGTNPSDGINAGYGRDGQITYPAEQKAIDLYPSWKAAMSARKRPLIPIRQNSQTIRDVFASGSDSAAVDSNSGASWLAPSGAPTVTGDWPELYVFPLGFLPLKRSDALGSATTAIARRFFDALAFVIDARPGAWNAGWSDSQWRTHFNNLQAAAPSLVALQTKALSLLTPANDPATLDQVSPVTEQIRKFLGSSSRWSAAVAQLVVSAPGIFGSAKGIQITAIGGQGMTSIRADLFRISQTHLIPTAAMAVAPRAAPPDAQVLRSTDIRQGLPDPGKTALFVGFDVLDDVAYGGRYTISEPEAQSFESLIDPSAGSTGKPNVYVPEVGGKPKSLLMALPSREPLTLPKHFFTGVVMGATTSDWWQKGGQPIRFISATSLMGHEIKEAQGTDADSLAFVAGGSRARTSPAPASRLDRAIVCGVFGVSSDEEGSFENDMFSVLYDPKAPDEETPPQDNNPVGLFATLMSVPLLENNAVLDQVADGTNIATILGALTAAPVSADPPTDACPISISGAKLDIGVSGANDGYCISAALYRQTTAKGVYRAFLIVTFEVPVWQIVKLGLYHSRDIIAANADVPPFAAAFGQTLGPIGSEVPFIVEQDVPKTGIAPIPLPGREWTTASLIEQLLVNGSDLIDGKQWTDVLAQVTIHHRQMVSLMTDDGSGSDGSRLLDAGSRFALVRSELLPGQPTPAASKLFPEPYKDFSVDFIWHMNGSEFFRIMDLPVSV